jgi:predicted amidohydrolase
MSNNSFFASAVQTLATLGDLDHNLYLLQKYTKDAARLGSELVVFPECMNTGYLFNSKEHCLSLAETLSGPFISEMANLCRYYGIYLCSGFTEYESSTNQVYNSAILLDQKGETLIHYRKQFLATHDKNWFQVGDKGCPVVNTKLGKIGLMICFDGRIPEIARCLAVQGAEVIIDVANFFTMDQAELWVPARALENKTWFITATKAGVERSIYYPGGSMIVAPTGHVLATRQDDTHGITSAQVDPDLVQSKKLSERRPEVYQILSQPFEKTPLADIINQPLVPEESTVKVAAVQSNLTNQNIELDSIFNLISHVAKLGVKVIVLPQYFGMTTFLPNMTEAKAESEESLFKINKGCSIAEENQCYLILSTVEYSGNKLAPTAIIISPKGKVIGRYHKVHLNPVEKTWGVPGNNFPVFETSFGRLGVILGKDGQFPESTRALALKGADIIAWPCSWQHAFERDLLSVPKAVDNRIYLICSNRVDSPYQGGSLVVSPEGLNRCDINISFPSHKRLGAVVPHYAKLAISRQKSLIPNVDLVRNRLVSTYKILTSKLF